MCPTQEMHTCSVCGERVPRKFCHRNRSGAYICHPCQAARRNAGAIERMRSKLRLALHRLGYTAVYAIAISLAVAIVAYMIVQLAA